MMRSHLYCPSGSRNFRERSIATSAASRYSKLEGHELTVPIHSLHARRIKMNCGSHEHRSILSDELFDKSDDADTNTCSFDDLKFVDMLRDLRGRVIHYIAEEPRLSREFSP